jgi:ABC-type dipeptide/oligopeptide/nickel transport system ATPase component
MKLLIEAQGIIKQFRGRGRSLDVMALSGIDFSIMPGEVVGIVGESGSGKSTLSRILVGIERASQGTIHHDGNLVTSVEEWKKLRRDVQYIFQDPYLSLAPHMTVGQSIGDGLEIRGEGSPAEQRSKVEEALTMVGLKPADADSYPAVFSGGQRQRISLARALVLNPKMMICDEIVSGLDVSVQAQILNLLVDLHQSHGVGLVFVSHDLRVVKYLCERIIVMHRGQIVESNDTKTLFSDPQHEYTRHLLECVPVGLSAGE